MSTTAYSLSDNIYRIDLQSPFVKQHTKKQLPALKVDSTHLDVLLERAVALQALYSYTKDSIMLDFPNDIRFNMELAKTYILDEWTRFNTMGELMIEFLRELRFRRNDQQKWEMSILASKGERVFWARPLVVLDGIPMMDHEIIYRYNPLLVERINVYQRECVYGGMLFSGIAEFLTYDRNYPSLSTDQSTQIVSYPGAQTPRRLYSPNYLDEKNRQSRLPDYRHTLVWEPMLQTKGKSTLDLPFYTSDFSGEFVVTVEGLTKEGEIIVGTASFEVR